MTLTKGTRLGAYEIVAPIGAGGMGEVFLARDTRLNRDVAIKVLPATFAQDKERVARFRREAQVVASLNHSHIASIYGLEESDGVLALVLEFVEGEDLAERLRRGAIPIDEAIDFARQIAEGLEEAHEKGIVHRDLKPANIKITTSGVVKILDFGLAKALGDDPTSSDASLANSPTMARPMTNAGMILGTAAYMSPEQARGKAVDKRSDIWSFGVVLYEMLTARRLFGGETVSDTLAAVLRQEVDLHALPAGTPAGMVRLLSRCLDRDPKNRLHDIADARLELRSAMDAPPVQQAARPVGRAGRSLAFWLGWSLAGAALLLSAALAVLLVQSTHPRDANGHPTLRVHFLPPNGERLVLADSDKMMRAFTVSPDGSQLVYAVEKGATSELRLRSLDSAQSTPLAGTEAATNPFFSPDGKWIGFAAGGKLKKVAVAGGAPVTLADVRGFRGAVWGDDGAIYFVPDLYVPISRIPAAGGPSRAVTRIRSAEGELQHRWPELLPGSKVLLYTVGNGADWDEATIVAERLDTGERKVLVRGGTSPRYLAGGVLIYARAGGLYAVTLDPRSLAVGGPPVEVARNVFTDPRGQADMDVSRNGLLVTSPADGMGDASILSWVGRDGRGETLKLPPQNYGFVGLSPQGDRAALSIGNGLSILDLTRFSLTKLTLPRRAEDPVWSHDGRRVYFGYEQGKSYQIYTKAADDSGAVELVVPSDVQEDPHSISRDGSRLLSIHFAAAGMSALTVHDLAAPKADARTLLTSPSLEGDAAGFSPNARWVVYQSGESGRPEIYVRPASGADRKWQVSVDGGTFPVWSPAGNEIFFLSGSHLLAAPVSEQGDDFVAGQPKVLFANHRLVAFDVARDGNRFLVAEDPNPEERPRLDIVVHWTDEVQRKVKEAGVQ
jgi:serine/threonine protein kinase/Tol biopolymer transport system component